MSVRGHHTRLRRVSSSGGRPTPALPARTHLHLRGRRTPQWFHGLLDRGVAEDLLLKSPIKPKEGLFLVRQSSNRGGCFVISVCTGHNVNHYLIETLESMFYVKRESGGERGRDIQACDLVNLVECYKRLPLDISGLTLHQPLLRTTPLIFTTSLSPTPSSTKDNHNYIPLYVDHRYYVGKEDYCASDLEATSFNEGEPVTIILKETKKWWFGFNSKGDLGYVPSGLLSPNYDTELLDRLSDGLTSEEDERLEISEFAKMSSESDSEHGQCSMDVTVQQERKHEMRLDANSNIVDGRLLVEDAAHMDSITRRDPRQPTTATDDLQRVPGSSSKGSAPLSEFYVSTEYITACVKNHEQKLVKELMYAQRVVTSNSDTDDREWVFRGSMDMALLKGEHREQIVPDVDMETEAELALPSGMGHVSEAFEEDLWAENNETWNLATTPGSLVTNIISDDSLSCSSSLEASSVRTESTSNLSEAYDPVETYLRLCDCWSRPTPTSR